MTNSKLVANVQNHKFQLEETSKEGHIIDKMLKKRGGSKVKKEIEFSD